jgi:Ca2+-binding RTX toxin-like protein
MNGDGKAEILVGAAGNDAGGVDAGAVYVVRGKASDVAVNLTSITAGSGGFRIRGEVAGDGAGHALGSLADVTGDGRAEILIGAAGNDAGGVDAGAAYVVFGRSASTEVLLSGVSAGSGGYRIIGSAGEQAGAAVAGLSDVNGDGLADMLVAAPGRGRAYVVFGKADTSQVLLSAVAAGTGGYAIQAGAAGDVIGISVAAGGDFNRDGIADLVIGTPHNAEGGSNAGAAYIVWGGGKGTVDLSLVTQGIGGAKIVGMAGSLTGASVAALGDLNADGTPDLVIGSPGTLSESANVVYAPASWRPDPNIYGTNAADTIGPGFGRLHLVGETADSIYGLGGNDSIAAAGGADMVDAGSGNDNVDGGDGADSLLGSAGNDTVLGGLGADTLDGGTGTDSTAGGPGDDTYVVDGAADLILEVAGEGTDTVLAGIAYTLAAELEALVLTGAAHAGTGNATANTITGNTGDDTLAGAGGDDTLLGNAGNDSLDGGTGADSMAGGAGNDRYVVDAAGDVVTELAGGGSDTVLSAIDYTLDAEVEALALTGTAHHGVGNGRANALTGGGDADTLEGLSGADTLNGDGGNDSLDGGSGLDSMVGGAGDDTYLVDATGDVVAEAAGGGSDTVLAASDYTLSVEIEALVMTGAARHGTGSAQANTIIGNDLGDTLAGAGGDDTLLGGNAADSLDGGTGADSMAGGAGDDAYAVDSAADVVVELPGGGTDTVTASVDYILGDGVEALVLAGTAHHGTGNTGDNSLTGGAGDDTLDGAGGADSMLGGAGNDTYMVADAGDTVAEAVGGGIDTIIASIDTALADNVEVLVLTGSAHHGVGNAGDNSLTGGSGADSLEGGLGNDTLVGGGGPDSMVGGGGDDTYYVTDPGDVVNEDAGGGFDTVVVSTDWTLADYIEAVQLLGSGHALGGNAAANELSGNSGDDTLDGGAGDDTELGGDGADVLVSGDGFDILSGGSGDDRYVLKGGSAKIEDFLGHDTIDASEAAGDSHIDLSGTTASVVAGQRCSLGIGGNSAAPLDVQFLQDLTGSFADDIITVRGLVPQIVAALQAVQPNSEFGVSTFRDKPIGAFGGAGDWVYQQSLSLAADTMALIAAYTAMVANNGADGPEAQIEALMQLALHSGDVGYRSNAARFVVLFTDAPFHNAGDGPAAGIATPNNGDGVLDGTPPGTGEDYPFIAQVRAAIEAANIIPIFCIAGGYDSVYQQLVTDLGRGAEVTLTSDSSNVVSALTAGLTVATTTQVEDAWGGAGNDDLLGNSAANYLLGNGGQDTMDGAAGADTLDGGYGDDQLLGGAGADSLVGGLGNDVYVVDNAGDKTIELANQGTDTVQSSITWALDSDIESLVLTGTAAVDGTGNVLANSITGNAGNNLLQGGAGDDTLDGGAGSDSIEGGAGRDVVTLSGPRAQTTLTHNTDGTWTATGPDGTDQLIGIELLRFSDGDRGLATAPRDFDGSGTADILFRATDGSVALWQMNGLASTGGGALYNPGAAWTVAGTGDFDGDGKADILWRDTTGNVALWQMNGTTYLGGGSVANVPLAWSIAGIADFNGDGRADILWRNADGSVAQWWMNGTAGLGGGGLYNPGTAWQVAATADFNGDGRADILWRNADGSVALWLLDGTTGLGGGSLYNPGSGWSIAGTGDFNGDGKADIVWRDAGGALVQWWMDGATYLGGGGFGTVGADRTVAAISDFDGDGKADILWRNDDGSLAMWQMDGLSTKAMGSLYNPGANWAVVG